MKKRIIGFIVGILAVALVVTLVGTIISFRSTFEKSMTQALQGNINTIELTLLSEEDEDYKQIATQYHEALGQDLRITLIAEDGTVLADTKATDLGNHLNRPEVMEALSQEFGVAVRHSETTGFEMLYVAKKTQEGTIVRIAMPMHNTTVFINQSLPYVLGIFIALMVVVMVFSNRFAKSILSPFYQLRDAVRDYMGGERKDLKIESKYEELEDISTTFSELADRLNRYISDVKMENKKSSLILDHITEGLMVLDEDQDVMLVNRAAREIFGVQDDVSNVNILHFVRDHELIKKLDESLMKQKNMRFDIANKQTGRIYRFMTSIVPKGTFAKKGMGMMLLISDVTDIAQAEQVRRDFAANVSHELKTPLTSIYGFAQLMENDMVEDKQVVREYAKKISDEADRLMGLINDTLKISELENITMEDPKDVKETIDLREAAQKALDVLEDKIAKKEVHVSIQGEAKIQANPNRIQEILVNLCENGVKYNRQGGELNIELTEGEKEVTIMVQDSGIGISPEEQSRIFERFYRAQNAGGATVAGTGLGLAIVKHAAALYNGRVTVTSILGEGSTFMVVLEK